MKSYIRLLTLTTILSAIHGFGNLPGYVGWMLLTIFLVESALDLIELFKKDKNVHECDATDPK